MLFYFQQSSRRYAVDHWSGVVVFDQCEDMLSAEVLLVCEPKKGGGKDEYMWSLPGGKGEDKETPEETAIRELREETKLDGEVIRTVVSDLEATSFKTQKLYFKHVFLVSAAGEIEPKPVVGRSTKMTPAWYPLRKLPRNLFKSHKEFIVKAAMAMHQQ